MNLLVFGTPEHEGRICGRAFDRLGVTPRYLLEDLPHAFDDETTPDVILVSREWSRPTRVAVARARRRGIPVVYVMDGVIEWSYVWNNLSYVRPEGTVLQPLLADHLCAIGRHAARILASLGLAERLHVVGLPRLDGADLTRTIDPAAMPSIVVTTAQTAAHDVEQKVLVRRALRDLRNWFDVHPGIKPVWRIAPELAAEMNVAVDDDGSLLERLRSAAALLSFASTTLVEGMLMRVPTALIDYRAVPQYLQTAWEIRSADHIESVIQDLLHPPPQRVAFQDACLHDELEVGDASARLAEVLRAAAAREPVVLQDLPDGAGQPGRLDYRQVHSELTAFAVSPLSLAQYQLDATSNLLDLAMREVVRLRSEIAAHAAEAETARAERQLAEVRAADLLLAAQAANESAVQAFQTAAASVETFKQGLYTDRLRPLVASIQKAGVNEVTIYGAGDVGRALVGLCRGAGISVKRVADRDASRWDQTLDGIPITALEECRRDRAPVIAIASFSFASEMRRAVRTALLGKADVRIFAPRR